MAEMGSIFKKLYDTIHATGIWDGARAKTHSFLISPEAYQLNEEKLLQLQKIGKSLHVCLTGLARLASYIDTQPIGNDRTTALISRVLKNGVPKTYHPIMFDDPDSIPFVCKVDIMETQNGSFKIAEIDGHNKHGLGYTELNRIAHQSIYPDKKFFAGASKYFANEARARNASRIGLLYSSQERFYLPEFLILKKAIQKHGITLEIMSEEEIYTKDEFQEIDTYIDFPFIHRTPDVNKILKQRYIEKNISFLLPPKPYFGSKGVLALLRNDTQNTELENILLEYIPAKDLHDIREVIPETYLADISTERFLQKKESETSFVLKKNISSGMKDVFFPNESDYEKLRKQATQTPQQYVLQKLVETMPYKYDYWDSNGDFKKGESWFVRLTLYYSNGEIADAKAAARKDVRVHGAKDCLQLTVVS